MRLARNGKGMGWRRSKPDHMDGLYSYSVPHQVARVLPTHKDLRPQDTPIYDQGTLGSCTGNGVAALVAFARKKHRQRLPAPPSRLMIYYGAREIEHDIPYDAGAEVRDALKAAVAGACFEDLWPYDINRFAERPSPECFRAAAHDRALVYRAVRQDAYTIKGCLAHGYPIVFGFTVYPSIDQAENNGLLPMPGTNEREDGGHCVVLMGYNDKDRHFIVRNSWGTDWGDQGYFYMPYEYVLRSDLSDDLWMIEKVG